MARPLTGTELAIVRDVINDYTFVRLLTVYGAEDVTHLCQCLSDAIERDHPASVSTALLEQALLCIRALETELTKERDTIELWREASEHEGGA